ncbi:hypothetical protein DPM33_10440 [Mesorhizobium hawassense]|uniref:Uncharacterized protein n=1 Tax=Mesorhizobium hawassense TaxID=1209954 RepID=A0A330HQN4_9HYPH|nr:hypothetical protein DPM33_10440 [Mesorhizobium hawassense]
MCRAASGSSSARTRKERISPCWRRCARAIPGKVRSGFPSGIASKQRDSAVRRFRETVKRSSSAY